MKKEQAIAYEKAKTEVAEDIAAAELAKIEKNELARQAESQQEREQLIAEAYRLTGRVEGLAVTSKFADVSALLILKDIKEKKIYRDMPCIGTWENFCNLIGFSRSKVDENLQNLETFGNDFLTTVGTFGIGYRELRKLRSAASDGTLTITDQSITISIVEGETETIPLNDTTHLKDALEELIIAKDEVIAAKERELKAQKEVAEFKAKRMDETEKALMKAEKKLREFEGSEIAGMPSEDYPAFSRTQEVVAKLNEVFHGFKSLLDEAESLSETNRHYLGNSVIYMLQLGCDLKHTAASTGCMDAALEFDEPLPDEIALRENMHVPGVKNIKGHKSAK